MFPSTPYTAKFRIAVTSTAAGAAAVFLTPSSLANAFHPVPTFTANHFPITSKGVGQPVPEYLSINASYAKKRITSYHIKGEYIGAPLNASGEWAIKMWPKAEGGANLFPANFTDPTPVDKYFRAVEGFSVAPSPVDLTYRVFEDVPDNATVALNETVPYPEIAIYGTGLEASKTVLQLTVTACCELLAEPSDFASRLATVHPESAFNPKALQLISSINNHMQVADKQATSGPKESLAEHVDEAAPGVGLGVAASSAYSSMKSGWAAEAAMDTEYVLEDAAMVLL
jgi:hypothetical protein